MKIPPEIDAYLATNKLDEDYKTLLEAIRKGNWNYDETKLESEYKSFCHILKINKLFYFKYISVFQWMGTALMIILILTGGLKFIESLFYILIFSTPVIAISLVIKKAKIFLAHTYKLTAGGIKTS